MTRLDCLPNRLLVVAGKCVKLFLNGWQAFCARQVLYEAWNVNILREYRFENVHGVHATVASQMLCRQPLTTAGATGKGQVIRIGLFNIINCTMVSKKRMTGIQRRKSLRVPSTSLSACIWCTEYSRAKMKWYGKRQTPVW